MNRVGMLRAMWLVALVLSICFPASAAPDLDPYVDDQSIRDIRISPTGEYFAATVPLNGQTGLVILRRSDRKVMASFHFRRDTHVADFWWVNPDRVLMSIAETFGTRDQPVPTGELYAMNIDGSGKELLVGWRVVEQKTGTRIQNKREENVFAYLTDPLPADREHVLVTVQPWGRDTYSRVDKMNVYTGRRTRVTSVPVASARFVTDGNGTVRFAEGSMSDNYSQLYYRGDARAEWVRINHENESGVREVPLGFSADGGTAYLRAMRGEGTDVIVALDVATGKRSDLPGDAVVDPRMIYLDDCGECIDGVIDYSQGRGVPIGMRFLGERIRTFFLDEESAHARLYRSLEDAFKGNVVRISSSTDDGRFKVVLVQSDVDPGSFYLFDTVDKKADFILARSERIDPEKMAPMRAISLEARDGLKLHGFVTTPVGSDGKRLPMIVMPHGGPFGVFDAWDFDSDTQVLAEAGYAVLRVNFRGSGNYGRRFRIAGAAQWGGAMQDDLTDATRWAVAQGIADPERICIYGASYGGYAALMGVAREQDLYRCAIGYVGVYDLPKRHRDLGKGGGSGRTWGNDWMGDDLGALAAASPNRLADRIRVPVFLAAGGEDQVAPIEHSEMMERALKRAGTPVETLYYPREGHGFYAAEHRREFYRRLLAFLDRNLGAGSPSTH